MPLKQPPPEMQLQFLNKLQRIFAEGDFTATYKFALLIALADLAVEFGSDDDKTLTLTTHQIGFRFIALYWKHAIPYGGEEGNATGVLLQNTGSQAAVISAIESFKKKNSIQSLNAAIKHSDFNHLLKDVSATVSKQPLTYLQNFGGGTDYFIYTRQERGNIQLNPGIGYCLRRFYTLVQELCHSHWIKHIRNNRNNINILGKSDDLQDFLFSSSRKSLEIMGTGLRKLDGDKCFYCKKTLTTPADVDHYIPFSWYPRDIAHNLVLAHPSCNRSKSDTLAAKQHLERWLERMETKTAELAEIGEEAGLVTDHFLAKKVGAWAYRNAFTSEGKAWVKANHYILIDDSYIQNLARQF